MIQARMTTIVNGFYIRDALTSETMGLSVFYHAAAASFYLPQDACVPMRARPPDQHLRGQRLT